MLLGRTLLLVALAAPIACAKKAEAPAPAGPSAPAAAGQGGKVSPIALAKLQPIGGGAQAPAERPGEGLKQGPERKKLCDQVMKHVETLAEKENPQQAAVYRQEHAQEVEYCEKNVPDPSLDCILKATTHTAARSCLPAHN